MIVFGRRKAVKNTTINYIMFILYVFQDFYIEFDIKPKLDSYLELREEPSVLILDSEVSIIVRSKLCDRR